MMIYMNMTMYILWMIEPKTLLVRVDHPFISLIYVEKMIYISLSSLNGKTPWQEHTFTAAFPLPHNHDLVMDMYLSKHKKQHVVTIVVKRAFRYQKLFVRSGLHGTWTN